MFKTVRSKFTLGYLSLVLVICFLGVVSIYTMSSISTTIEGLITTNYNSIDRLAKMRDALWNQRLAVEERPGACVGCGYEHNCSRDGCAVLRQVGHIVAVTREGNDAAV